MNTPKEKAAVRGAIESFCETAERFESVWHYTQQRPFGGYGIGPQFPHANDCSGYVALAFDWAMHRSLVYLAPPLGMSTGWGNTWTEQAWLHKHGEKLTTQPFLVGDIALYDGHTTICRSNGSREQAVFSSFGQERGPLATHVGYRDDLVGVYRHPALL